MPLQCPCIDDSKGNGSVDSFATEKQAKYLGIEALLLTVEDLEHIWVFVPGTQFEILPGRIRIPQVQGGKELFQMFCKLVK